jgi:transposase InsO family protein
VPFLVDLGKYIASESSFYRILKAEKEQNHRGRSRAPRKVRKPRTHIAFRPNQVWSWDVTWVKGPAKGVFFYLYMILDVFSRKIVGWEVWQEETGDKAVLLVQKAVLREGCPSTLEVLHADNGAIQKSSTLRVKLADLGVEASYSPC